MCSKWNVLYIKVFQSFPNSVQLPFLGSFPNKHSFFNKVCTLDIQKGNCHVLYVSVLLVSSFVPQNHILSPWQMRELRDGDLLLWPQDGFQLRQLGWWELQYNQTCSDTTHLCHIMSAQYLPRGTAVLQYQPLKWGYRLVSIYTHGPTAAQWPAEHSK